jgi:hypothetical protein
MKKIFYVLAILVVFIGCTPSYTSSSKNTSIDHINYIHLKEYGSVAVFSIEYDGHTYLVFDGYETMAVEHSPDCYCQH